MGTHSSPTSKQPGPTASPLGLRLSPHPSVALSPRGANTLLLQALSQLTPFCSPDVGTPPGGGDGCAPPLCLWPIGLPSLSRPPTWQPSPFRPIPSPAGKSNFCASFTATGEDGVARGGWAGQKGCDLTQVLLPKSGLLDGPLPKLALQPPLTSRSLPLRLTEAGRYEEATLRRQARAASRPASQAHSYAGTRQARARGPGLTHRQSSPGPGAQGRAVASAHSGGSHCCQPVA